ncbi:MAG: hypothetical protein U0572_16830 [Phycisphaerales bacterium]
MNSYDLGLVLGAWGSRPGGVADIAAAGASSPCGDNVVDAADLAAVFGAWGDCPGGFAAKSSEGGTPGPTPLDVAESMGFASLDEFVAWLTEMDPESMSAWLMTIFGS